ncbi:MAG: helix-turn-helix domain-containing protein [Chloroflexia bacterium]|nr:helix-turn-helix domain-containing protein [Chloroflexia bacterium]
MGVETGAGVRARRRPLVGAQVRRMRTELGLTLAQVGERTGLNVGYLSQVETDKASPSLETLAALADAFGVPITWLLVEATPPPKVVRKSDRPAWVGAGGVRGEEVDGGFGRSLRIAEVTSQPGTRTPLHADPGEEHHLVLEGTLRCRQGEHEVTLGPGDYLLWDGTIPHEAENIGDCPARLLIVTAGPTGISVPDRQPAVTSRGGDGNGVAAAVDVPTP